MRHGRGFSLVEVLIVVAIVAVSLLSLAGLSVHLDKAPAYSEAKVHLGSLAGSIRETLKYKQSCEAALMGINSINPAQLTPTGNQQLQIKIPKILSDGTNILAANTVSQKLNVRSIRLVNSVNVPGTNKYFSEVELTADIQSSNFALKPVIAGGFYYTLPVGGGPIQSCDTLPQDPSPLCEEMGCTWNVTQSPPCVCQAIDLTCPAQQYPTGIDANSQPVCTALGSGPPCAAGTYLQEVHIGGKTCIPLPAAAAGVDGACGSANGQSFAAPPTVNLCNTGTSANMTGSGPWTWDCLGSGSGTNISCSASVAATVPSGAMCPDGVTPNVLSWSPRGTCGFVDCSTASACTYINGKTMGDTDNCGTDGALCKIGTQRYVCETSCTGSAACAGTWDAVHFLCQIPSDPCTTYGTCHWYHITQEDAGRTCPIMCSTITGQICTRGGTRNMCCQMSLHEFECRP